MARAQTVVGRHRRQREIEASRTFGDTPTHHSYAAKRVTGIWVSLVNPFSEPGN
jgi:hypothetical protein